MRLRYHPPVLIQKLFSDFIWKTSNNKILLTFDDGPTESATQKILVVLKSYNIKAVFFCVGNNVKQHPELTKKIIEDGHTIANHTMNHKILTKLNREESVQEIQPLNELMRENFDYEVKYFRPAYGRFNFKTNSILNALDLKCIMWNLLSYDFESKIEKVKYSIDNFLREDSIIVFHDNLKCSGIIEEALIYTIGQAANKGYQFGEPEDCLK